MKARWLDRTGRDLDRGTHTRVAVVDGTRIVAHASDEAVEDHGIASCHAVAARKLSEAIESGALPKEVLVTTADF
jgi:hypothetical protein